MRLLIIGASLGAVVLALSSGTACDLAKMDENTPAFRFKNHFELLDQDHSADAYAILSSRFREEYYPTLDEFLADIEDEYYLVYYDIGVRDTTYDGDTRAVVSWNGKAVRDGRVFLMAGGAEMVMEDGDWMIDGVFADVAP